MNNLNLSDFKLVSIDSIDVIEAEDEIDMYDITVEDNNTFFIKDPTTNVLILSHNCDGFHISGLLFNLFYSFWPELFEMGVIHRFITPLLKATIGKEVKDFYTMKEFKAWAEENKDKKYSVKYYKGLGTSETKDFREYFSKLDKHLIPISVKDEDDKKVFKLIFSKEIGMTDERKKWLAIEE